MGVQFHCDKLIVKDDALEVVVSTSKEQIEELKGELIICKASLGNRVLVVAPKLKMDVSKPKEFKGMRSARDVDNFVWGMEQYF